MDEGSNGPTGPHEHGEKNPPIPAVLPPPLIPDYGLKAGPAEETGDDVLPPFRSVVPPEVRVRPTTPESSSFALADGRRLEVLLAGPEWGVPLVFHHGTPFAAVDWPLVVGAAARRGMRLVMASRPGYGASTPHPGRTVHDAATDTLAVLDQLGHRRFYVVGWSGGGPHTLACAAAAPGRCVAAATVAGVAPYGVPGLDWMEGMGPENVEEFSYVLAGGPSLERYLQEEALALTGVTGHELAESLGGLLSPADLAGLDEEMADVLAAGMRAALAPGVSGWRDDDLAFVSSWGFDLGAMASPVAIWQGDQDRMVPAAHGAWLAEHVAGAQARLLPGEGHLTLMAGFDRVVEDLVRIGAGVA